MATTIRPELSTKNRYWIDRHRYYELKHFCLQYPQWKKARMELDGYSTSSGIKELPTQPGSIFSPTEAVAEARLYFLDRMRMVEQAAEDASPDLGKYLLIAVTEGCSYEHLKARLEIPCCKDVYYDIYRRFFWLLDKARK